MMVTYDQWKCTDPREFEPEPEECHHEVVEVNWEGRAECTDCGHSWWASAEEIAAQERREREYAEWVAEQEHPWNRFKEWLRAYTPPIRWPRKRTVTMDDEIPF